MSKPLCKCYIEKLLTYLEENGDQRDRYRSTLHNALDDPMVSKLMTTPLYTAIIVLLVKMGGTPPRKRYALFEEYCDIVVKREQQKEMLPSLHNDYDWIKPLHAQIGFLLQTESETAQNAAAELSTDRCMQLITQFLRDEEYEGDLTAKAEELYQAITNRLSFLSAVTGADQKPCVLFPLRSIQEYFAAEQLISLGPTDMLTNALEIISVSVYWRNVYLFVAGYITKDKHLKNMNEALFRICLRNNGDENYESPNAKVCRIALQGSRLALDLLCDNLFNRPSDQHRYLNVAARLLEQDTGVAHLAKRFSQLPSAVADLFLLNNVVPHIEKTKSVNGLAFKFLWLMAHSGHEQARIQLGALIDGLPVPDGNTIRQLMSLGFSEIGDTAIQTVTRWITQEHFSYFTFRDFDEYWHFFAHVQTEHISHTLLRQVVYKLFLEKRFKHNKSSIAISSCFHPLIQRIISDQSIHNLFTPCIAGELELMYSPIMRDWKELPLLEYVESFQMFQLNELAALIEFLHTPSYTGLRKILEAYRYLPENCKDAFAKLIENFNWLLQEIANRLKASESLDSLLSCYDSEYFDICLKKDKEIEALVKNSDVLSIARLNLWNCITLFDGSRITSELLRDVLAEMNETNITEDFISSFYLISVAWTSIQQGLFEFGIRHFPLLFQYTFGVGLAFSVFDKMSLQSLISGHVKYPNTIYNTQTLCFEDYDKTINVLKKIDKLAELGEEFLQVYSLFPYFLNRLKYKSVTALPSETGMQYLKAIDSMGNPAALLGCILRILIGPVSDEQRIFIQNKLAEFIQTDSFTYFWFSLSESFSIEGRMLVYETVLAANVERNSGLLDRYACAILDGLEAEPIQCDELMDLFQNTFN